MSNESCAREQQAPNEYDICLNERVSGFKDKKVQIITEAIILSLMFIVTLVLLIGTHFASIGGHLNKNTVRYTYAFLGALLGGWTYDVKWFYKSVANAGLGMDCSCGRYARETNEEHKKWTPKRFYWRIFTPFVSAVFGFAVYSLIMSGIIFPQIRNSEMDSLAHFGVPYIIGLFADLIYSRLATWIAKININK